MAIGKVTIREVDPNNNGLSELAGYINYDVNATDEVTKGKNNTLDSYVRAITSLTVNSYMDADISYTYNLEEILND